MTNKTVLSIVAIAAALAGCSADSKGPITSTGDQKKTPGTVEFNLDLPNGESTDTIELHLECPGIDQVHELDVVDGEVVAAFGGLEGDCTATLHADTAQGTDCDGTAMFTVVPGVVTPVTATLVCQGYNGDEGGGIRLDTDFVVETCETDRIRKIYAIPGSLLLGQSTNVEVELHPGAAVGSPVVSFALLNSASDTATAALAAATCAADSASCQQTTCTGLGGSTNVDPSSGLPYASVYVQVTVEDDNCRDTELVQIECLQASVCGDGVVEGVEQCDDGNTLANDGCNASCVSEICGDGIINGSEQCDGTAGVGANQECTATCELIALPFCGDGIVTGSEQCDGAAGLLSGQLCDASCAIVPTCGNGHVEGAEQCDDGNLASGDGCTDACVTEEAISACESCVTTGPIATNYTNDFCSVSSDPACWAVLECYIDSTCFATASTVAECYCGIGADTTACEAPTYTPTGPCAAPMLAAAGAGALNADVLNRVYDFNYSIGWAGQIMLEAQASCPADCGF